MGGQHGVRGYLLQAIITTLESLSDTSTWETVTIEPSEESEKVDVIWEYDNKTKKVVQIKSSQNTINYSAAKKWANELNTTSEADVYELICIGHVDTKLNKEAVIDDVKITKRPLDFDLLLSDSMNKLDQFYEHKGKSKLNSMIKEILLGSLNFRFTKDSIFGKKIGRGDFDETLLKWLTGIENHVSKNPFVKFLPQDSNQELNLRERIATNFLTLIGWNGISSQQQVKYFNEKELTEETAIVDYYISRESKLKDNTVDHILVNTVHDFEYPEQAKVEIRNFLNATNKVAEELANTRRINSDKQNSIFSILFWISTDSADLNSDFVYENRDYFRNELLNLNQQYYFVDNIKANFIISSIGTAKNYRNELPVKFLYPITEFNLSYNKIGKRGLQLPPEYINTNVLPIVKEDENKISVLLFCADPYEKESLKKVMWLLIMLTSGMANEYVIYFSDYDDALYKNEVIDVVNSFDNNDLKGKIKVEKSLEIDTYSIAEMQLEASANQGVEIRDIEANAEIRINPVFREQLPYGDILKPILNTDRISAQDLKIFLATRGIFIKNSDKKKLIDIMVSLLFSPLELLNFINLINVKEKPVSSSPTILTLHDNSSVRQLFSSIRPNFSDITDGLQAKLNDPVEFKEDPFSPDTFVFSSYVEKKDLTKHIALNTSWEPIKITYRKVDDNIVINNVESNSRDAKIIANRIIGRIKSELVEKNFIQEDVIHLRFGDFSSNKERVNFLLSFIKIDSSDILIDKDIKGLKFVFDESKEIPDNYKDKTEKDLVILFRGKNLAGLREISEDYFKDIILLEEISITYKFQIGSVIGYYNVKYNFSDALKHKSIQGDFRSQSFLFSNRYVKQERKISELERKLNQEVEKLKVEKFRQFGKI